MEHQPSQWRRLKESLRTPTEPRLVPIGWAIGGMLTLALLIAGAIIAALFFLVPFKPFRPEALSAATLYDLLKVAFAFAAGIGGVVALVTAYRRQRISELAHELASRSEERAERADKQQHDIAGRAEDRELTRLFNERFTTASGQLGHDNPAIRLAGVYAMAGLADDWSEQRQTCVDVLCAYLRMPFSLEPAADEPAAVHQEFLSMREVRHTVIRVIAAHLQPRGIRTSTLEGWQGLDFDFRGATFDGGDFSDITFSEGSMSFTGATFIDGSFSFAGATFKGGEIDFSRIKLNGGEIDFSSAKFTGGTVNFYHANLNSGSISFEIAQFDKGRVSIAFAEFNGSNVDLRFAAFRGGVLRFDGSTFNRGTVSFGSAVFHSGGAVNFNAASFNGTSVNFYGPQRPRGPAVVFIGAGVTFKITNFNSGEIDFGDAKFRERGELDFSTANFNGGTVNLQRVAQYTHIKGIDWRDPPSGVIPPSDL